MPASREDGALRNTLTLFTQFISPWGAGGGGHDISCLLTLQMLHSKSGKDWPSTSWEDDFKRRRTTDNDRRQPIAV